MVPEQERMSLSGRHIPPEIIEEILSNLPVKSLLRFSTLSKSLNSLLKDSRFIRKQKSRAVSLRREKILVSHRRSSSSSSTDPNLFANPNRTLSLSSLSLEPIIIPFMSEIPKTAQAIHLYAMCDVMWCVGYDESMFLWNPSIRAYKKLPPISDALRSYYGLGFDSSSHDYKLLRINVQSSENEDELIKFNELYSLKTDSWKKIEYFPQPYTSYKARFGTVAAVNAVFHCVADRLEISPYSLAIISFDLSTEKYGVVAQPPFKPAPTRQDWVKLTVLRENLCVHVNYVTAGRFDLWMMQEYGNEKSWMKMFEIDYKKILPLIKEWSCEESEENIRVMKVSPLSFYDNGEIFIRVSNGKDATVIVHIDEKSIPRNVFSCCSSSKCICDYQQQLYVESLVSPSALSRS